MKWEDVEYCMVRARVPGGWLVKHTDDVNVSLHEGVSPQTGYEWRTSLCFVPDPNNEWKI
jgi:hypothetical protein